MILRGGVQGHERHSHSRGNNYGQGFYGGQGCGFNVFKLISVIVQTLCLCLLNQNGVLSPDTNLGESCRHLRVVQRLVNTSTAAITTSCQHLS